MASCDFSTHVYSYDDVDGDFELKNFKLVTEDIKYKIPGINLRGGGTWPTKIRGRAVGKSKKLPCPGVKFPKMIPCPGVKFS